MFPTWKDLEAFSTWKDLLNHFQPLAEQAQQQMWLEYTEAMQNMQAQVHALTCHVSIGAPIGNGPQQVR